MSEEQAPPPPPPAAPPPPPPSTPPPTQGGGEGKSENTVMLVLSYLWIFALIPFLVEKNDKVVQWHAKHGLVLTAAELVLWVLLMILSSVLSLIFAPIGCLFSLVMLGLAVGLFGFRIYCIIKAVDGQRILVPSVSQYADRF